MQSLCRGFQAVEYVVVIPVGRAFARGLGLGDLLLGQLELRNDARMLQLFVHFQGGQQASVA